MEKLYHGSKVGNIKKLEVRSHGAVDGELATFATPDIIFALAMVHGSGDQLAIDYAENGKVYLDEIEKGALELLEKEGYLYTIEGRAEVGKFKKDKRLLPGEVVSHESVMISSERYIQNILQELKKQNVEIVKYEDVLTSMEERKAIDSKSENGESSGKFKKTEEYGKDRFKSFE